MMNNIITKRSLADEVASKLQQQILLGKYKPNEKLPIEPELMKSFGVGRSSIREAIKILVNQGLLRVQQGLGTFVEGNGNSREPLNLRLKRADMEELDEVRQLLEMKIAEKAATNRTEEDIEKIGHWLKIRKANAVAGQLEACIEADIEFHTAIAEASKNEVLADLYKAVSVHVKNGFYAIYNDTSIFKDSQALHEQMLKCIINGDAKKAWHTAARIIGHVSQ
ncbi:FadR/GntR family transcriptional regulator [Mucilaginibacter sp. dw_454]|uniref:FadR/GntR family transcriptional regulator n=1 Tax=Mucilaginibacter sp. dw_454 TaxID=2720079 RepID=UPI002105977F|nr:FadR/GntR family transcriptional regulator [Mucilaginibacter sp. dw_454]